MSFTVKLQYVAMWKGDLDEGPCWNRCESLAMIGAAKNMQSA